MARAGAGAGAGAVPCLGWDLRLSCLPSGASLLGEKVWARVSQPEQELGNSAAGFGVLSALLFPRFCQGLKKGVRLEAA